MMLERSKWQGVQYGDDKKHIHVTFNDCPRKVPSPAHIGTTGHNTIPYKKGSHDIKVTLNIASHYNVCQDVDCRVPRGTWNATQKSLMQREKGFRMEVRHRILTGQRESVTFVERRDSEEQSSSDGSARGGVVDDGWHIATGVSDEDGGVEVDSGKGGSGEGSDVFSPDSVGRSSPKVSRRVRRRSFREPCLSHRAAAQHVAAQRAEEAQTAAAHFMENCAALRKALQKVAARKAARKVAEAQAAAQKVAAQKVAVAQAKAAHFLKYCAAVRKATAEKVTEEQAVAAEEAARKVAEAQAAAEMVGAQQHGELRRWTLSWSVSFQSARYGREDFPISEKRVASCS